MIAPLWADYDLRVTGAVYSRVTNDSDTLNQVVEMLADMNPALSDYQPTLAVVVTWFEPRLHGELSSPSGPPVAVGTYCILMFRAKDVLHWMGYIIPHTSQYLWKFHSWNRKLVPPPPHHPPSHALDPWRKL